MSKLLLFACLVVFTFWFPGTYKRCTHAFRPDKCLVHWPHVPEWEIDPLSPEKKEELNQVLSAPFSYYGKGAQSYVFLSEDGKHVLKLFRYDTCRVPFGQGIVRGVRKWLGMREKHFLPTEYQIRKNFTSCKLAYSLLQKETGIVYVHLNLEGEKLPIVTLKDRLGRKHQIDPSRFRFAIQKKMEPFGFVLSQPDPKPYFESYLRLLRHIASLGLVNLDVKLESNYGFFNGEAVVIDFGNLIYDPENAEGKIEQFERRLDWWLNRVSISQGKI